MKNKLLLIILTAGLLSSFTGCWNETDSSETGSETTSEVTTVTSPENFAETTAKQETEITTVNEIKNPETSGTENSAETKVENKEKETNNTQPSKEDELKTIAMDLLKQYSHLDDLAAGQIDVFEDQTIKLSYTDHVYALVNTTEFDTSRGLNGFYEYVPQFITEEAISNYYRDVFERPEFMTFIERDGKMYATKVGRDSGYKYIEDTLKLIDITDDGFKAVIEYRNVMDSANIRMGAEFIKKDGRYLICNVDDNIPDYYERITDLKKTAKRLFNQYDTVDMITAMGLMQKRSEYILDTKGRMYNPVIDKQFTCVEDIRNYIDGCLTGEEKQKVENILDLDGTQGAPGYIDYEGRLYCIDGGRACGFSFIEEALTIKDASENSFTVSEISSGYGIPTVTVTLKIERCGNSWLISSVERS